MNAQLTDNLTDDKQIIDREHQTSIVRHVVRTGMKLSQHGAESKLIEQILIRLGTALGLESVEIGLAANAIVVTGLYKTRCVTSTRRVYDRGINMHVVCEIQRLTIKVERGELSLAESVAFLEQIEPQRYNRALVVTMVGLSCASFSHLFGGDAVVFWLTFLASAIAMFIRQSLAHRHHNPYVVFCITAFVATTVATIGVRWQLGNDPNLILAASVLLLVPGFPLINAVSDMVKGYVLSGFTRWLVASMLSLAAAAGIALSMTLTGIQGWL